LRDAAVKPAAGAAVYRRVLRITGRLIMAALCNTAGHYIFALWFLSSSVFFFFPRLISAAADWISTILPETHGLAL